MSMDCLSYIMHLGYAYTRKIYPEALNSVIVSSNMQFFDLKGEIKVIR